MFDNEGHWIDDPLDVVNAKPDFSGLGMEPKHKQKKLIMKKTKDAVKRQLKEQWRQAVRGYQAALLNMWELDAHYGYWIGGEEGSVYDYGDGMFTIGIDDMIYCVDCDVTRKQYIEWQEYICEAAEFGFDTPNLRSFVRGCPRTSAETFKHLREIKAMLNDAIKDEKERVKNDK